MFSEAVLEHFRSPRNVGELANADAKVEVSNPVCGDVLQLSARLDESGRIAEARFLCRGCTTAIACGSFLTEYLRGKRAVEIAAVSIRTFAQELGEFPETTMHGAQLAADAAAALGAKLPRQS